MFSETGRTHEEPLSREERQQNARNVTRRAILDAALSLFVSDGYSQVSIRNIAAKVEYSPGAIYSYFASKEDIFFALAEEGLQFLRHHCASRADDEGPLQHVRAALWRFYTFSKEQPEYFSLIFIDSAVPRISRDWERFSFVREWRQDIEQDIQQCIDDRRFPQAESASSVFRILSTANCFCLILLKKLKSL